MDINYAPPLKVGIAVNMLKHNVRLTLDVSFR
jgi:hypothetical protein